jgi:phospholipid N-methyltransferase
VLYHDVVAASARLRELCEGQIDAVVSGIPFSFIEPDDQRRIVANTFDALSPQGHFVVYQNSTRTLGLLEEHFPTVQVMFEPRNFLPYFIMVAHKNGHDVATSGEKTAEKRKKRRLATSR